MRIPPAGFEHAGVVDEPWAKAQHNRQVRAHLGGCRCGERDFSMGTSLCMFFPARLLVKQSSLIVNGGVNVVVLFRK